MLKRAINNKLDKCKQINTYSGFFDDIEICVKYIDVFERLIEDGIVTEGDFHVSLLIRKTT